MPFGLRYFRSGAVFPLLLLAAVFGLSIGAYFAFEQRTIPAVHAAACPFTDNDGTDGNGAVGTYSLNTNTTVPSSATAYDCTSGSGITTFIVPTGVTMTLDGNQATGEIAAINFTNLQVDSGGTISANSKGCGAVFSTAGKGPDGSNVCSVGGTGAGGTGSGSSGHGGGGAGHGGAGGAGSVGTSGGSTFDSATTPVFFGASGGEAVDNSSNFSGPGGGVVRLNVSGTLTQNGTISASGGNATGSAGDYAGGGGAGGTVYITTVTINGTTGTFAASGGNGLLGFSSSRGGGGGGGRVAIEYQNGSFAFDAADFSMAGGSGPGSADDGGNGTVYVVDTQGTGPATDDNVNIFSGFTFTDTDYGVATWTSDAAATNQYCDPTIAGSATPSVTAQTLTFGGTLNCTQSIASFNLTATGGAAALSISAGASFTANGAVTMDGDTSFVLGSGATVSDTKQATNLVFDIPAADDQTWTNVTINGANEGLFQIDDAIAIDLEGTTSVNASAQWTALTNLTIASGAGINAAGKGCATVFTGAGRGPDSSNVCTVSGTGAGGIGNGSGGLGGAGAGHGGIGGNGNGSSGGSTFDSSIAPVRFGPSGGSANGSSNLSGAGGGYVRLIVSGIFTQNGTVSANGGDAAGDTSDYATGGGAGGSVYVTTATLNSSNAGSNYFTASGGAGLTGFSTTVGGGGGGGMVSIGYQNGSFTFDAADFSMAGGVGPGVATDGGKGTAYARNATSSRVDVFHGFSYATDYGETTWNVDPSATNQYCDTMSDTSPSVTATTLAIAGTLSCSNAALVSFNWSASSAFSVATGTSFTVGTRGATVDWNIPAGNDQTWTNVTISTPAESRFTIDDAAAITLAGTTSVAGNPNWSALTGLTIGTSASINADGKGCRGAANGSGFAPNGSNVCTQGATGAGIVGTGSGGAGHGGAGGNGSAGAGGAAYDSLTVPVLHGASGGSNGSNPSVAGGGDIRLGVSGTLTNNGTITANALAPATAGGDYAPAGSSGGSIYLTTGTYDCGGSPAAGPFSASGSAGTAGFSSSFGGGGAGGRVSIGYATDSCSAQPLSGLTAASVVPGAAGGGGSSTAGATGTLSTQITLLMSSAVTADNDTDGQIDRIAVTFNQDLDGTTVTGADFSVTGPSRTVSSASETSPGVVTIVLTESGSPDTGVTPTVNIIGSVSNVGGTSTATSGSRLSVDGAGAVPLSAVTGDNDADGQIDRLVATFSEDLNGATVAGSDFSVTFPAYTVASASETSASVVTVVLTESGSPDTDATPTLTVTGSVADLAANTTTSGSKLSTDNASAAILSAAASDGDADNHIDTIVATFSEDLNGATVSGADFTVTTPLYTVTGASETSLGVVTLTLTETGSCDMAATPTVNVVGSIADVPGNVTSAGSALTTAAGSCPSGGGGGGTPPPVITPAVTVASPNGGEILTPGTNFNITWSTDGRVDLVNLDFSGDGGSTWKAIAAGIVNQGSHLWTVPDLATDRGLVRVQGTDGVVVYAEDVSNAFFSIAGTAPPPAQPPIPGTTSVTVRGQPAYVRNSDGCRFFADGVSFPNPKTGIQEPVSEICPGDRITTPSYRTVYLIDASLMRHPFFNAIMYLTHYADFGGVKVVTDATLETIDLRDLMLPKPGVVLVKVPDRAETYALFENPADPLRPVARVIEDENVARSNFGASWADDVIDIPPTMFDLLVLNAPISGKEDIDTSHLRRRVDLARVGSPFTFAFFHVLRELIGR